MTLSESIRVSRAGALSIDGAFVSTAYVGAGQADGPYPGMYEHWSSQHVYESSGLAGQPEQTALVAENEA